MTKFDALRKRAQTRRKHDARTKILARRAVLMATPEYAPMATEHMAIWPDYLWWESVAKEWALAHMIAPVAEWSKVTNARGLHLHEYLPWGRTPAQGPMLVEPSVELLKDLAQMKAMLPPLALP